MTRPRGDPSYDVRVWSIRVYKGRRSTTYIVTWLVAGLRHQQTFATRKLAESFRSGLITASRGGMQFMESDGLPESLRPKQAERTWYAHACAFIDLKWTHASPSHRRGLAEALVWVTTAMVADSRDAPDHDALRRALFHWSFNVTARGHHPIEQADVPDEFAEEVAWITRRSLPLRSFASASTVRRAMDAITMKLDGTPAAAPTVARRRAALFSALEYAVELELLPSNQLKQLKLPRPIVAQAVDRRVVVNHAQARTLLSAVRSTYPSLEAYFACLYYAGASTRRGAASSRQGLCAAQIRLGPADPRGVHPRLQRCLDRLWTGKRGPPAQTPWRQRYPPGAGVAGAGRDPPPAHRDLSHEPGRPALRHPDRSCRRSAATALQQAVENGHRLSRLGHRRAAAFTDVEYASPLAKRPYDLRHAALSTWLNAGVPPTQVAEWAGHSVMVLLRVYAKCIYGQEEMARARIESALALPTTEVPDVAQTYRRITGEQP